MSELKKRGRPELPLEEHERRLKLWEQGLNDQKMAEILYIDPRCICLWRNKHGLAKNDTRGGKGHQKKVVLNG